MAVPAEHVCDVHLPSFHRPETKIVKLDQACWAKTVRPPTEYSQILPESNWYRVGALYAGKLKEAGDAAGAQTVLDKLGDPVPQTP